MINTSFSFSRRYIDGDTKSELELTSDKAHFVFGGDAVDKGVGDIRICRELVALKKKYPSRVGLLLGNRDLNKLRYATHVAMHCLVHCCTHCCSMQGQYWATCNADCACFLFLLSF